MALVLIVGAAAHFLLGNVADPDLWAHLQYGRMILAAEGVRMVEVFSYTAAGAPFYDHEWLFDVLCAALFDTLGAPGLILGKALLLTAMLVLLLDAARTLRDLGGPGHALSPLVVAAVLILALAVIGPGATFRAQLFTMLLLAFENALLLRAHRRLAGAKQDRVLCRELLVVPPLLALWANLHGGFLVGLGLFGLYLLTALGAVGRAAWSPGSIARPLVPAATLVALGLAAILAPLANPFGWELYVYLARTLGMHGQISEWQPIAVFSATFLRFKVMVLLTGAAFGAVLWFRSLGLRRAPLLGAILWQAAFCSVAAWMAFRQQRHTVLFGIVATPVLVFAADRYCRWALARWPWLRPRGRVFAAVALGAVGIALFQIGGRVGEVREHGLEIRFSRFAYPIDAVTFLNTYGFGGNVAMPFEWGAYTITKMAPAAKVFIDGRFEAVYPPEVIHDYFAFLSGQPGWERLLDAYPTDIVVVERWRGVHPRLFARDDLVYVYSDPAALVFVRPGPRTQGALSRLAEATDRQDFPREPAYFP